MNRLILLLPLLVGCGRTEAKYLDAELVPVVVEPEPDRWVQVAVGPFGHCVRSLHGRVECGSEEPVVLVESGARDISVGGLGVWSQTSWGCALLEGDEVACISTEFFAPPGEPARLPVPAGSKRISIGYQTGCALTEQGEVWCSQGYGLSGPLFEITGLRGATEIDCGYGLCCALMRDGAVSCATLVDIGNADPQARAVPLGAPATAVSAGMWHACALHADGTSECWGTDVEPLTPTVRGSALAAGFATCVLDERRHVACTGDLGDPFGEPVQSFDVFGDACAITEAGVLRCVREHTSW